MVDVKSALGWTYASGMAIFTAIAADIDTIEPDRLVWVLALAGSLFGIAFFPSESAWRTMIKLPFGWVISVVLATPVAQSHYAPSFVNIHVAALWLGFAGPAIFMGALESRDILSRLGKRTS